MTDRSSEERSRFEKLEQAAGNIGADPHRDPDGRYSSQLLEEKWQGWTARAALEDRQEAAPHVGGVCPKCHWFICQCQVPGVPSEAKNDRQEAAPEVGLRIDNLINYAANLQSDTIYLDPDDIAFIHEYYGCKTGCCTRFAGKIMKPKVGVPSEATPSKEFIGTVRRRLFIPVDHEWNGVVREVTAKHESGEMVPVTAVLDDLAAFYRRRATLAMLKSHLNGEETVRFFADNSDLKNPLPQAAPAPEVQGTPTKENAHLGDPCRYCNTPHDDVPPGPCKGQVKCAVCGYTERDKCHDRTVLRTLGLEEKYHNFAPAPVGTPQKETPPMPTNRHGQPVSAACYAGKHEECAETFVTCNCTYRGKHNTVHAYATAEMAAPVPEGVQGKEPQTYYEWRGTVPDCLGSCDGDLPGEVHDEDCPMRKVPNSSGRSCSAGLQDAFAAGRRSAITEIQEVIKKSSVGGGWLVSPQTMLDECAELQEKTK